MTHILDLFRDDCYLTISDEDSCYISESLSPESHVMYCSLNACLSWLMTGSGAVIYYSKHLDTILTVVLTRKNVILLLHYRYSIHKDSMAVMKSFSALDFCKDILKTFLANPKGWSEFTKDPDRTAEEIEAELIKLADEVKENLEDICGVYDI